MFFEEALKAMRNGKVIYNTCTGKHFRLKDEHFEIIDDKYPDGCHTDVSGDYLSGDCWDIVEKYNEILYINEVENEKFNERFYNGIKLKTRIEEIYFLIDNDTQCCENFGTYLSTPDKLEDYIGAEYLGYSTVKTESIIHSLKENENIKDNEISFLNMQTSKGEINYAVYNSHNGYYSHDVLFIIKKYL